MSDIKPVRKRKRPVKRKQSEVEQVFGAASSLVDSALNLYKKAEPLIAKMLKGK